VKLRDYQQRAIDMLYAWFGEHPSGNPCLVLPTGAGKSLINAALVKDALTSWPGTRVIMLTHVKELILQNAEKLLAVWPEAPLGIYSASVGSKQLDEPVTFAGIQSIWRHAERIGHVDLVIVDECHLISHHDAGQYRRFISGLAEINPAVRVIGLTASPFRLGHGMIHEGDDTLFDDLVEPVTVEELVHQGYLAPLRSKHTSHQIDVSEVAKRGGEFIAGALERAVDNEATTQAIVEETLLRAGYCRSMLFFCAGVDHAEHMAQALQAAGVKAACITGKTPNGERSRIIEAFKDGRLRALTNANVLTTGFDAPNIDCLVMARPTMSPTLYIQMAGRGMRLKDHTEYCLVLDFAGNVRRHGPITAVEPPSKGKGPAPTKECPNCDEIVPAATRTCPICQHEFEFAAKDAPAKEAPRLHNDDIMGLAPSEMAVRDWQWRRHVSRSSGAEMLAVTYYGDGIGSSVTEYLPVLHDSAFGVKMRALVAGMADRSGAQNWRNKELSDTADALSEATPPERIIYRKDGKYHRVLGRVWDGKAI
jgi:DNA repair protein RadD